MQTYCLTCRQIFERLKRRYNNNNGSPEYRLPLLLVSAVILPIGMLIYAWTAQYKTYFLGPDIGVGIFGFGVVISMSCISGYMIESFPTYAASAMAAATCLRSFAGFVGQSRLLEQKRITDEFAGLCTFCTVPLQSSWIWLGRNAPCGHRHRHWHSFANIALEIWCAIESKRRPARTA